MGSSIDLAPETYRNILESLPAAVCLIDRERRIVLWNEASERITGHLGQEVIGRRCADNLLMDCEANGEILCGAACPLDQTAHDGQTREADVFLLHKDGHRVPVRIHTVPVRDEEGSIIGACECFDEHPIGLPVIRPVHPIEPAIGLDQVTQLPDRSAILRRLEAELQDFRASGLLFGVLCLTVDNLDGLRETGGGKAAKSVLRAAGRTLASSVGPGDLVGYWSEDEFVAIVNGCTEAMLLQFGIALKRLAGLDAVPWWGGHLKATMSVGGTIARAEDTAQQVVERAGLALRNSMETGPNRVAVV